MSFWILHRERKREKFFDVSTKTTCGFQSFHKFLSRNLTLYSLKFRFEKVIHSCIGVRPVNSIKSIKVDIFPYNGDLECLNKIYYFIQSRTVCHLSLVVDEIIKTTTI